jgi:hypothetical protein
MPLIENGNPLTSPVILPGWTYNRDPFGLGTSTTKYKCDHTVDIAAFAARGQPHPDTTYSFLKANSYSVSWDALGIATVTVDYVGIPPSVNGGTVTNPNCSGSNGLTAQNVTAHPNFFTAQMAFAGAIAGPPPYTQDAPNNLAPTVGTGPAFLGLNGSCFEKASGGRFIGFVDPAYPSLYGKTQYLAPTTSYSGVIYMTQISEVTTLIASIGTTSSNEDWGTTTLLASWAPVGTGDIGNKNLLSQVNVEEYGALYKVMYEIRFSEEGWDQKTYAALN